MWYFDPQLFWKEIFSDTQILSKIIEIVATFREVPLNPARGSGGACSGCQILWPKYTKFDFGWGSTPDPAGGALQAPPDPLAGFKGTYSKYGHHDFDPPSQKIVPKFPHAWL